MTDYCTFWGETHDNTYQFDAGSTPIDENTRRAASHLDFYAAAYYTSCSSAYRAGGHISETESAHGLPLEGWKAPERLDREWREVQDAVRKANRPGEFVAFPGYEWQGDGTSGDHNVVALNEGLPIFRVATVAELYAALKGRDALAIPHHTAYRPGVRGRDWSVYDPDLTPYTEIYSIHGCSETDEEWIGLRQNSHMGPGVGAGTWQAALDRGYHVGAICSTDNWGEMPGHYGQGRMACLAAELTRESLWEAFKARRVYGVTGDRIGVDFRLNDAIMGEAIRAGGTRRIRIAVTGSDALDRIELLRNGRVMATHNHQGTWALPSADPRTRFKVRIEAGWGPRENELTVPDREWDGCLCVDGGRMLGFEPCWISPGQSTPELRGEAATFRMLSSARHVPGPVQNANVFEFEAAPGAVCRLEINGLRETGAVIDLARGSRELCFRDECTAMLESLAGLEPGAPERADIYHHMAYKVKIHRPIPEAGYRAEMIVEDDEPLQGEANYRVRVEQRNGQRAWSSPIWVSPAAV